MQKCIIHFEKEIITDKNVLCNDNNKSQSQSLTIRAYIFSKPIFCKALSYIGEDEKYNNYTRNIFYNEVFNKLP